MDITEARTKRDEARMAHKAAQDTLYEYRERLLAGDSEYQRLSQLVRQSKHRAGLATLEFQRDYASKPDNRAAAARALERESTRTCA